MPTAALVVIGNEILTGKFADENGPYLIRRLRTLGCDLQRLVTIPDVVDDIGVEVAACARRYDHVVTSGGVGPTHDDLTLEGVAAGLGVPLETREELVGLLRRYEMPVDEATLRMARVPQGTELVVHPALSYPILHVRNVWVLPGVPKLFKQKFELIAERFAGTEVATARLYVTEDEPDIALRLQTIAARHSTVDIGSYPRFAEGPYKVIVTLESRDPAALAAARDELKGELRTIDIGA